MKIDTNKIRLLMAEQGQNQKDLALKAGLSASWVGFVLQRGSGGANVVYKIANALNVDPKEIIKES